MAWRKNDPSLGNDPSYLEPRISKNEKEITNLQRDSHTHENKAVLDKFNEDPNGNPTFDGQPVGAVTSVNEKTGDVIVKEFSGDYNDLSNKPNLTNVARILLDGSSNFNSTTGRVISHSIGHLNYRVIPIPTQNPNGYLGEVWVEKALNSFIVKCSGTATTTFDYVVMAL